LAHGEQDVLGRDVLVAECAAFRVGALEHTERARAQLRVAHGRTADARELAQRLVDATPHLGHIDTDALDDAGDDALALVEQRAQEVLGSDLGVSRVARECLRGRKGFLGLTGEAVRIYSHD
jgi:hypothetical protein